MTVSRILIKQQIDTHYYFQAHIFASKNHWNKWPHWIGQLYNNLILGDYTLQAVARQQPVL